MQYFISILVSILVTVCYWIVFKHLGIWVGGFLYALKTVIYEYQNIQFAMYIFVMYANIIQSVFQGQLSVCIQDIETYINVPYELLVILYKRTFFL